MSIPELVVHVYIFISCIDVFLSVGHSFAYIGSKRQNTSNDDLIRMDGTIYNLEVWDDGEPEHAECVLIKLSNYKLHDAPCEESHFFLCTG